MSTLRLFGTKEQQLQAELEANIFSVERKEDPPETFQEDPPLAETLYEDASQIFQEDPPLADTLLADTQIFQEDPPLADTQIFPEDPPLADTSLADTSSPTFQEDPPLEEDCDAFLTSVCAVEPNAGSEEERGLDTFMKLLRRNISEGVDTMPSYLFLIQAFAYSQSGKISRIELCNVAKRRGLWSGMTKNVFRLVRFSVWDTKKNYFKIANQSHSDTWSVCSSTWQHIAPLLPELLKLKPLAEFESATPPKGTAAAPSKRKATREEDEPSTVEETKNKRSKGPTTKKGTLTTTHLIDYAVEYFKGHSKPMTTHDFFSAIDQLPWTSTDSRGRRHHFDTVLQTVKQYVSKGNRTNINFSFTKKEGQLLLVPNLITGISKG